MNADCPDCQFPIPQDWTTCPHLASQREEALDIALILLDRDLPDAVRTQAAEDLEECFLAPQVQDAVEAVLYAAPLPEDADLAKALLCAQLKNKVYPFLMSLRDRQPLVRKVRHAWESVTEQYFGGPQERRDAQTTCIRAGLFRDLVKALGEGKQARHLLAAALAQHSKLRRFEKALERWAGAIALDEAPSERSSPAHQSVAP